MSGNQPSPQPSDRVSTPHTPAVTVLGLGPMGRALAGAFLAAGVRTTVWNRTPGREGDLVERGAVLAASAAEAVAASPLTVICLVNYDATDAVLRQDAVEAALKGRALVNLSADIPERSRDTGRWAEARGIAYVDGAIMTPADTIGSPHGVFLFSGPAAPYEEHRAVLDTLGGTHTHLGEEISRAAAYDIALLDLFWTSSAGYWHALALARAEGIEPLELAPFAAGIAQILPSLFEELAHDVQNGGDRSGDINPLSSAVSTMAHVVHAAEAHGIDSGVMRAVEGLARRTVALGDGAAGPAQILDVLRGRRPGAQA
ncbi:NAD(P)-dependent oxidoreductase [Streptomyces sp. NPDC127049]|uniref:NAD(P)-dependent oxidoreductase n=1 Tax=Streptomyces sp. NPDC127049 TaxID=3347118 RepID=UPI00365F868D